MLTDAIIGVRANIHLGGGGADRVLPEWIQWGGGSSRNVPGSRFCGGRVVAEIFRDPDSVGWQNFSVNSSNRPSIRVFCPINSSNRPSIPVIHTCIVFCPKNFDSLPEFMSTNCPNWGATAPPQLGRIQKTSEFGYRTNSL